MSKVKYCSECNKKLYVENQSGLCQQCYWDAHREQRIEHWLATGDTGIKTQTTLRGVIRDYIYESQDNKCSLCGVGREWNGKPINLVLDHIDGDASNNRRENLRLVCPNCDSQLPTFKSRNRGSARSFRNN